MTTDPSKLSVEEVRELLRRLEETNEFDMAPKCAETFAALCQHYLDSQPTAMTAGEFAGLVIAFCDEWGDKFAELLELDKSWTFNQVIEATREIAREHNVEIV